MSVAQKTSTEHLGVAGARSPALLEIRDIGVRFGGIVALEGVSFDVQHRQICGLIGPNGAGKTTLFNCLSRIYTPNTGAISFDGVSLLEIPRHGIARLGIGRTFQNLALFGTMSVRENVMVGGHSVTRAGYVANVLRLPSVAREEARASKHADDLIDLLGLGPAAERPVSDLTFAILKRVELARALASKPRLLLLDEPAGGLNHEEVEELRELIRTIRDQLDVAILLVEHHLNLVMRVSDKVVALNFGRKIADGDPSQVRNDEDVIRAYLGTPNT